MAVPVPRRSAAAAAPYVAMTVVECLDVGLTTLAKAAMSRGMSQFVFVFYSNALATIIFFLSFLLHRTKSPPLTLSLLFRFFLLALVGITIVQSCVFTGISYSSPTLGSAMSNLVPGFTFLIAVLFRIESNDVLSSSGLAKFVGTLTCIGGALVVTLCRGPPIVFLHLRDAPHRVLVQQLLSNSLLVENWAIGGLFLGSACLSLSLWNVLQAQTVKKFPAEMTIVSFNSLFATIQCGLVCLIIEKDPHVWKIRTDVQLVSILYSAIVGSVITPSIITWCMHKMGPLFIATFKPLSIVFAAIFGCLFLCDTLYVWSVNGAIIIVVGFYSVMWGKSKEEAINVQRTVIT